MRTLLIRNIPEDIHRKFKKHCAGIGVSIQDRIIRLMEYEIKHDEQMEVDNQPLIRHQG